ncbi:uncharacterized protein DS421_16g544510 [Arachis hypogaea]|nr:uncharacterized protein DS421_16g544510 [Arachis hypogaea]
MSNTFKLQFKVKLKLKRGNEESNPGGAIGSNTFKLQFKVKLKLKRGNEKATLEERNSRTHLSSWCLSYFWRLTSSLRLNWRLNVEMLPGEKLCRTRLSSSLRLNWSLNVEMFPW